MTSRFPHFTEHDELTLLRALVELPASALRCLEVDEVIEVLRAMRVQRVAGEFPVRFTRDDRRCVAWLIDELAPDSITRGGLFGLLQRIHDRVQESIHGEHVRAIGGL